MSAVITVNRCIVPNKLGYRLFKNLTANGTNDLRYRFHLALKGKVYLLLVGGSLNSASRGGRGFAKMAFGH